MLVTVSSVAPAGSSTEEGLQAGTTSGTADCESVTTCYTPRQLEVAYGVQPLLQRGIDGRGETVVLPELAESQLSPPRVSDLRRDFVAFDHLFHLPAPTLKVISTFPHPAHPWYAFGEEVLDVEVVHAITPRAALTILLVKGNSLDDADNAVAASVAALRLGASAGGVISLSPAGQIGGEHCVTPAQATQVNAALVNDAAHHVTVVAASGDVGAAGEPCALITALGGNGPSFTPMKEVSLVTSDPLVLSAGGTTLDASHRTGAWKSETAWGQPDPGSTFQASGGGFSNLFGRPSYQNGVEGIGAIRGMPDVAADANPHTGFPLVTSNVGGGYSISGHAGTEHERAPLGRDHGPRRPVREAPSRLRQPSHLPDRPWLALSPGVPRHHGGEQHGRVPPRDDYGLPSWPGLGSGNRLGKPERRGACAPTCSRCEPLTSR